MMSEEDPGQTFEEFLEDAFADPSWDARLMSALTAFGENLAEWQASQVDDWQSLTASFATNLGEVLHRLDTIGGQIEEQIQQRGSDYGIPGADVYLIWIASSLQSAVEHLNTALGIAQADGEWEEATNQLDAGLYFTVVTASLIHGFQRFEEVQIVEP